MHRKLLRNSRAEIPLTREYGIAIGAARDRGAGDAGTAGDAVCPQCRRRFVFLLRP